MSRDGLFIYDNGTRRPVFVHPPEYRLQVPPSQIHVSDRFRDNPILVDHVVREASWKEGDIDICELNLPIRTRSLFVKPNELLGRDRIIKLKGAGGFPRESFFGGILLAQPDPTSQITTVEVVILFDEKFKLNCIVRQSDHERCLEFDHARAEHRVGDELFTSGLSFGGIVSAPYTVDGKPLVTTTGDQLGFVALDYDPRFKVIGRHCSIFAPDTPEDKDKLLVFTPQGENYLTFLQAIPQIVFYEHLKAKVRMRAIIQHGLIRHMPHGGNFMVDPNRVDDDQAELVSRIKITDLDESSTNAISDFSPKQRAANLVNEIAFGIFRTMRDNVLNIMTSCNIEKVNSLLVPKHIRAAVDGYLEDYLPAEKREEISQELEDSFCDHLSTHQHILCYLASKRRGGATVSYVSELCFANFRLKCISEIYDAVLKSKRFRDLEIIPTDEHVGTLDRKLKRDYLPYLREIHREIIKRVKEDQGLCEILTDEFKYLLQ